MFKSLTAAAILVLSGAIASAQTSVATKQSLALTNHVDETPAAERPVSPEAKAEARRLYKEGVKYGTAGLFAQAAEIFEQAVKLDPRFADAQFALGHAYFDMRRWAEAAESLERAVELNPKDIEAKDRLSFARTMLQPNGGGTKPVTAKRREEQPPQAPVSMVAKPAAGPADTIEVTENKIDPEELALTRIYRIGANDVLDVRVADSSSLQSTLFTVTPTGLLEHPQLPEPLQVSGLTVEEVSARIGEDLKRRALDDSKVSVGVRDYASHAILVSGLVKESGTKILRREAIPLYVVVADAQPLPEAARVSVVRNESNQTFEIDLAEASEMNMLVRPGDVVTVHANETQFLYVGGEVKFPGEKTYRRGLTLTQALISAGGTTDKGKEARLARDDGKGFLVVTKFKLKAIESGKVPDPPVKPGDRITVVD
ncbi:MAG TPA: polysaccharide biosynthesis/export family protein [Pyrinomonadaceae bacterium]|nr:polysaccharide biosynthesis/export family protein [Pyrinomonadaceae bacterium]